MTAVVESSTEAVATLGSPGARLLAGNDGRENLSQHLARLGPCPPVALDVIARSGLTGRGGGHFPLARKAKASIDAPGVPIVVINATESEPGSAKDRVLATSRPHLVLDGAQALAGTVRASVVVVTTHAGAPGYRSLLAANAERTHDETPVAFVAVPDRYVAGESSALVSFLNGGPALPMSRDVPTAVRGVQDRPTVVSNAETVSHLALIARFGSEWFRTAGSADSPGSVLLTVIGDVPTPTVVEVLGRSRLGDVIAEAGGVSGVPSAALIGGYAGTWMSASDAWGAPVDASVTPLGCGLVGVFDSSRCGLAETAHLLQWLSGERAGQCGACALGLPELADRLTAVATGERRGRGEVRRLVAIGHTFIGRGLCNLPDGAVAMAESALVVFADEVRLHRRGRCRGQDGYAFPTTREQVQ
jgi:NADH:ubiquinone oxidoreductase subunit F (NADH-binding)